MSPRIAVTGATGFIGSVFVDVLARVGHRVRALTRQPRDNDGVIEWIQGDLANEGALARLVNDAELVVHLAGGVRGASQEAFDVNVSGARTVGRVATASGVSRLLFVSSLAAREPALSFYASSKRAGEAALLDAFPTATVLRPPAVYGSGDRELLPLLDTMRRGFGVHPGHAGRFSLIHVDDLAAAMLAWIASVERGGTFEVDDGATTGHDWREVLASIDRLIHGRVWRLPVPRVLLHALSVGNQLSARAFGYAPMLTPGKVRELYHSDWVCRDQGFGRATDWRPVVDLDEGLRRTFPKISQP